MKFFIVSVFLTVALASCANAQLGFMAGLAGRGASGMANNIGNGLLNRMGLNRVAPPVCNPSAGTTVANAVNSLPGNMAQNTFKQIGVTVDCMFEELTSLPTRMMNMITEPTQPIFDAVDQLGKLVIYLSGILNDIMLEVTKARSMSDLFRMGMSFPSGMMNLMMNSVNSLLTIVTQGNVPFSSILPKSMTEGIKIFSAMWKDMTSAPSAFFTIGSCLTMSAAPYLGGFVPIPGASMMTGMMAGPARMALGCSQYSL